MNTEHNAVALLCDAANIESKASTLEDVITRLLDDTAEMTNPADVVETTDLVRNLNELRRQLLDTIEQQQ